MTTLQFWMLIGACLLLKDAEKKYSAAVGFIILIICAIGVTFA